jgi:hypothetical protein
LVVFIMSCREKTDKKTFSEVKGFDTPVQGQEIKMPTNPHPEMVPATAAPTQKLSYTLPKGWNAHVGTGMYYAVLKTSNDAEALEGGIIILAGEAGGLQANVERWAGQLGLTLSPTELTGFIAAQKRLKSKGNLDITFIDYSPIVDREGKSMMVGITKPGDDSYFIKITGPKANLVKAREDFIKFCESLVLE